LPTKKPLKFSIVDCAVIIIIVLVLFLFVLRSGALAGYNWNFSAMQPYFFYFDEITGHLRANVLIKGIITTIKLSSWAILLGFFLGTLSGVMGAVGSFEQRLISRVYVETVRNIPSLVLVIIFYFFVSSQFLDAMLLDRWLRQSPDLVQKITAFFFAGPRQINAFISAAAALGIYEGAYVSEIVRGGIISIQKGQWEASMSVGLDRKRALLLIILPQAFRKTAFPLAGQFISTIKDSAIVSVISIQELTFQGMELMSATFLTFEIWITITLLYFILTFSLSSSIAILERKYALKQ